MYKQMKIEQEYVNLLDDVDLPSMNIYCNLFLAKQVAGLR